MGRVGKWRGLVTDMLKKHLQCLEIQSKCRVNHPCSTAQSWKSRGGLTLIFTLSIQREAKLPLQWTHLWIPDYVHSKCIKCVVTIPVRAKIMENNDRENKFCFVLNSIYDPNTVSNSSGLKTLRMRMPSIKRTVSTWSTYWGRTNVPLTFQTSDQYNQWSVEDYTHSMYTSPSITQWLWQA